MGDTILNVMGFRKSYGGKLAVRDLSLQVEAGDIFGFVGKNGAGKTTLIRSVVGAQPFDAGAIEVCGANIARNPVAAKCMMAYVPDNPDVYDFMTGEQYLSFMADVFGVGTAERNRRASELAERLEMAGALHEPVSGYSHGMRQKLVLMGALIHDPRLLVLDEPFAGLDPTASHTLKELLHERARSGAAVFFSSHVLEVVERLCNKVAVIRGGELLASGSMDEVRGAASLEDVFLELMADGDEAGLRRRPAKGGR